jgi:hypothetical protein
MTFVNRSHYFRGTFGLFYSKLDVTIGLEQSWWKWNLQPTRRIFLESKLAQMLIIQGDGQCSGNSPRMLVKEGSQKSLGLKRYVQQYENHLR